MPYFLEKQDDTSFSYLSVTPSIIALQSNFYCSTGKLFRYCTSRIVLTILILLALILVSTLCISVVRNS